MLDQRFATRPALYVLTLFCVLFAGRLAAQQPPPPPVPGAPVPAPLTQAPTPPGEAEKKPTYGQWWLLNAREVTPQPPGWLFHAEGSGSFANSTGSVSGFQYTGVAQTAMRKGLVTNQTFFSFNVQEQRLEDNGGSFKQTAVRFTDMLLININKPVNLVTAVIWDKDEPKAVLHRVAIFEGLAHNFNLGKQRVLGLSGAIGYEDEHDFSPQIDQDQGSATVYLQNTFNAPIAKKGMFTHFIEAFIDLVNEKDFRLDWNLGLNLQLTPHIGIGPTVQIRYDGQPVVQIQTTDTSVMFAVQVK